jgi:hypothetical protein
LGRVWRLLPGDVLLMDSEGVRHEMPSYKGWRGSLIMFTCRNLRCDSDLLHRRN